MIIYVVESMGVYLTEQIGWSTSLKVAEEKAKEFSNNIEEDCWVTEYELDEEEWCEFD